MAQDTPLTYRNLVIYEIYVRGHGPNGTFADVEADLARIRSIGVDVIWFMPIHPIGQLNKKGSLGSPYSISDYRGVNPEYGTREDFARLIERAHGLGLKVMIDVVYNHTSHDSLLAQQHPEFFHQDENGRPVTINPDWSDVIDLKHPNPILSDYLIETLQDWARFGVDGFRCDVASLLPLEFWQQARQAVARVRPGVIWLAESVDASFLENRRRASLYGLSDSQVYEAFDLTYDYDIWKIWRAAVRGRVAASRYLEMLRFQEVIYPQNYVKMRCVENHDNPRIMRLAPSPAQALAWTALAAFNKGAFLIYAGQESAARHIPSHFDNDKIEWGNYSLQPFLTRLASLKKDPAQVSGKLILLEAEPAIQAAWDYPGASLYGVFNVSRKSGPVRVRLPDGVYPELLTGSTLRVTDGKLPMPESAAILRYTDPIPLMPAYSDLFDYSYQPE